MRDDVIDLLLVLILITWTAILPVVGILYLVGVLT